MGIVIVSPIQHVIEKNGPPTGFCPVDTYWTFDENKGLDLEDFYIIQPDMKNKLSSEVFIEADGQNIFYKAEFTQDARLNFFINFLVQGHYKYNQYIQDEKHRHSIMYGFLRSLHDKGINELRGNYLETEVDQDQLRQFMLSESPETQKIVDDVIVMTLRNYAANNALAMYRAPVKSIGNDYWCDEGHSTGEAEMGQALGALDAGKHFYHPQHELESMINGRAALGARLRATKDEIEAFIAENQERLSKASVDLVTRISKSGTYQMAVTLQHRAYQEQFKR